MSHGPPDLGLIHDHIVSEEEYLANKRRAEEAQAQLDQFKAMNEAAKQAYDKQQELLRKIAEGKEAERQLQALTNPSASRRLSLQAPPQPTRPPVNQYMWHSGDFQTTIHPQTGHSYTRGVGSEEYNQYYRDAQNAAQYRHYTGGYSNPAQQQNYSRNPVGRQQIPAQQPPPPGNGITQPLARTLQPNQSHVPPPIPSAVPHRALNLSQQKEQTRQQRPQAAPPVAAVPNFVHSAQVQSQSYRAPPASESSLAGALDDTRSAMKDPPAQSGSTQQLVRSTSQANTALSATAGRLQQQLEATALSQPKAKAATPAASGSRQPSTTIPSETKANPAPPAVADSRQSSTTTLSQPKVTPAPPVASGSGQPSRSVPLTSSAASTGQKLGSMLANWALTAPTLSELMLTPNIKAVKNAKSQVFIMSHAQDGLSPITFSPEQLQSMLARSDVVASNTPSINQNGFQHITAEEAKGYRPYSIPQHQHYHQSLSNDSLMTTVHIDPPATLSVPAIPPSTPPKPSVKAPAPTERTPRQADKRSLAKDILRALKRPQPDDASTAQETEEPPAKRHASATHTPQVPNQTLPPQPAEGSFAAGSGCWSVIDDTRESYYRPSTDNYDATISQHHPRKLPSPEASTAVVAPAAADAPLIQSNHLRPVAPVVASTTSQTTAVQPATQDLHSSDIAKDLPAVPERQKTPLFLPSPSSSPVPEPSYPIQKMLSNLSLKRNTSAKEQGHSVYVLVPPAPEWVRQYKAQRSGKERRRGSSPLAEDELEMGVSSSSSAMAVDDEDIEVIDLDPANDLAYDESEREAVLLSCSRTTERPCKWDDCKAILSSTAKLIRHFAFAHREIFEEICICRWQRCGRHTGSWSELFQHLKGHALIPLDCAYEGCTDCVRTARQLARHHQVEHRNDTLKASADIFIPTLECPAEAPQMDIPFYLMEPVRQPSMSKDRHATLGPWVLRQIAGPVSHEVKRYNLASKLLQSSRNDQQGNQSYDFLDFPSTNYSATPSEPAKIRGLEDLMSAEVSNMVYNGLVLWGPPKQEEEAEEDLLKEEDEAEDLMTGELLSPPVSNEPPVIEQLDVDAVQAMLDN